MTAWQMQIRITGVIYILAGGRGDVQVATRVVARYLAEHQVLNMSDDEWRQHLRKAILQ